MYKIKALDHQVSNTNNLIPVPPFSLLITASKGCGKSTMLLNLIKIYKGVFDRIILFSPTVFLDHKWGDFINNTPVLKTKKIEQNYFGTKERQEKHINEIYTEYSNKIILDLRKNQEEKNAGKVLVIFEDSLGLEGVYKQNSAVLKYLPNSRHLKTSFIFVVQSYKSVPRILRNNNSGLILFQTPNDRELNMIYEENSAFLKREDWHSIYDYIMKQPYNFMFINYQNKRDHQVLKNFDTILKLKNVEE